MKMKKKIQINENDMKVISVETFKFDHRGEQIVSQQVFVESTSSADRILEKALQEYDFEKVEKVHDDDVAKIYQINNTIGEFTDQFFIGWIKRDILTDAQVDEFINRKVEPENNPVWENKSND